MVALQERLVALISKPPEERQDWDIEMVLPWLRKRSDLLQGLEKETLVDVIRNCGYLRAKLDDTIIVQGEKGDSFFIMLTGRTSVFIDTTKSDDEPGEEHTHTVKRKAAKSAADEYDFFEGRKKKSLNRSQFGKFIMYFDAGKSFGEIALISDDSVRNATVIADEDTDLLVINRELFNRSMKAKQEEEYRERQQFITTNPLFARWSTKSQHLLEMSLRKETFHYGARILTQGEPCLGLVFLLSGQAKLVIQPSLHPQQFPKYMAKDNHPLLKGKKAKEEEPPQHKEGVTSDHIRVRRRHGYAAAEKRLTSKSLELCSMQVGEILGDVEMSLDLDKNIGTVVATARTEVFVLNVKNYERLLQKKNPHTLDSLRQGAATKLAARLHSPKAAQVPLLSRLYDAIVEKLPKPEPPSRRVALAVREREAHLATLMSLFLQDRVPLIEPYVRDSLYYRENSILRTKHVLANAHRFRRQRLPDAFTHVIRRTGPRSIEQLKNNPMAERELMGVEDITKYGVPAELQSQASVPRQRPLSGPAQPSSGNGDNSRAVTPGRPPRPRTALGVVQIRECDVEFDIKKSQFRPEEDRLDDQAVNEIFHEMEWFQKEKSEERMRVMSSLAAKAELRQKMEKRSGRQSLEQLHCREAGEGEECYDWETSDSTLRGLEDRIARFCSRVGSQSTVRNGLNIAEMRRFELQDPAAVPLPGGTVFVHRKFCHHPTSSRTGDSIHKHIRRFMLSRKQAF